MGYPPFYPKTHLVHMPYMVWHEMGFYSGCRLQGMARLRYWLMACPPLFCSHHKRKGNPITIEFEGHESIIGLSDTLHIP